MLYEFKLSFVSGPKVATLSGIRSRPRGAQVPALDVACSACVETDPDRRVVRPDALPHDRNGCSGFGFSGVVVAI